MSRGLLLVGLHGRKFSGKDTVGVAAIESLLAATDSFAAPIKTGLSVMFGVPVRIFNDPALKDVARDDLFGHSPRYLMQTLGTEWGRDMVKRDLWAQLLVRRVKANAARGMNQRPIFVTDVRFNDEAEILIGLGGEIWHVNRDKVLGPRVDGHVSEDTIRSTLIAETIDNNGTVEDLYRNVQQAYNRYKDRKSL